MPREVEAARLPRLALTLHLREALAVQLEHPQPRLDDFPDSRRLLERPVRSLRLTFSAST